MRRFGIPEVAAGVLASLLLGATATAGTGLKILAPPDGAAFTTTPVTLIGSGSSGVLEVLLNGRKVAGVRQSGKAFTAPLALAAGKNILLVKSGLETLQSTFEYRPREPGVRTYRYHDPVVEGECKACHPQGVGRTSPVTEAKLCSACHEPKTGYSRLHGPLGTGQCSICHDPHGSSYPAYLVMSARALCVQCHAQSRSQSHIERSSSKQCPECHNPHGSEKQYLLY